MKQYLDKIDQKQLRLLLAVTMILILFVTYQFGFLRYNSKTEAVEEENIVLQQRYNDLSALLSQEAFFKQSIEDNKAKMNTIIDQYSAGNTPEKSIKFLLNLSKESGMTIPTITFSPEAQIFSSQTIPSSDGLGISAYSNTLSITYQASYQGLKSCIDYINQYPEHMNIKSISASYDTETGNLTGDIVINQYSIVGSGKLYESPVFDDVNVGTNSIFGTYELPETSEPSGP